MQKISLATEFFYPIRGVSLKIKHQTHNKMKRRNFLKTTGYSLGAVTLLELTSTEGFAQDTTKCVSKCQSGELPLPNMEIKVDQVTLELNITVPEQEITISGLNCDKGTLKCSFKRKLLVKGANGQDIELKTSAAASVEFPDPCPPEVLKDKKLTFPAFNVTVKPADYALWADPIAFSIVALKDECKSVLVI